MIRMFVTFNITSVIQSPVESKLGLLLVIWLAIMVAQMCGCVRPMIYVHKCYKGRNVHSSCWVKCPFPTSVAAYTLRNAHSPHKPHKKRNGALYDCRLAAHPSNKPTGRTRETVANSLFKNKRNHHASLFKKKKVRSNSCTLESST